MTMRDISEKTGVSIGLIITVGAVVLSGATTSAVAIYRVGRLEDSRIEDREISKEKHALMDAATRSLEVNQYGQGTRITVVETTLGSINATLGRIEGKIDGRNSETANYRPQRRQQP